MALDLVDLEREACKLTLTTSFTTSAVATPHGSECSQDEIKPSGEHAPPQSNLRLAATPAATWATAVRAGLRTDGAGYTFTGYTQADQMAAASSFCTESEGSTYMECDNAVANLPLNSLHASRQGGGR